MSDEKSIEIDYTEMAKGIKNLIDELKKSGRCLECYVRSKRIKKKV